MNGKDKRNVTGSFINSFIRMLFTSLVGIGFLLWCRINKNRPLIPAFFVGVVLPALRTDLLSERSKQTRIAALSIFT